MNSSDMFANWGIANGRRTLRQVSLSFAVCVGALSLSCRPLGSSASSELQSQNSVFDRVDPELVNFAFAYANPQFVFQGQPVTLYWDAPLGGHVEINGLGIYPARYGSAVVYPTVTQDYQLTVINPKGSASRFVHVDVYSFPGAVTAFWSDPPAIPIGSSGYLRWRAEHCDFVEIREDSSAAPIYRGGCGYDDSVRIQPTRRSHYYAEAYRDDRGTLPGFDTQGAARSARLVGRTELYVDIIDQVPEIRLEAFQTEVREGQPARITWWVKDGENVQFEPPIVSSPGASGSVDFLFSRDTTVRLTAYSKLQRQKVEQAIHIKVTPRFRVDSVKALPEILEKGKTAAIRWESTQCRRVWVTKISGERVSPDLSCSHGIDVTPAETTQYVVHFEYEEYAPGALRTQDVPISLTVVGGVERAIPRATPPPAPATVPPPAPKPTVETRPVDVPRTQDVPKIVVFGSNSYTTWDDENILIHWKALRADRVILVTPEATFTLPAKGKQQIRLKKSGKIKMYAENSKYRTLTQEIAITVTQRDLLEKLLKEMRKTGPAATSR